MATATLSSSLQQLEIQTRQRLQFVKNRPSTRAAEAFFAEEDGDLVVQIRRLAHALRQANASSCSRLSRDPLESKRLAWHAAMANQARKYPTFYETLESFFQTMPEGIADDLETLGWIQAPDGLLYDTLQRALHAKILEECRESIQGDYESDQRLPDLFAWSDETLLPWLQQHNQHDFIQNMKRTILECFVQVRCEEIFDIVADYPDSQPAIQELCQCLEETQQYSLLGQELKSCLVRRLTHVGANTSQIIDVYISTIKVLRLIDPTDRLLAFVAEPVRQYLQHRSDTIRCIIHSLTDADSDLYRELRRLDVKPLEDVLVDSDDEDEPPTMEWQPPPSILQPHFFKGTSPTSSSTDILAMLVSIYGSKELFVQDYRIMLADKLLQHCKDYNTDKEVHTLELLKLRFGDSSMRNAEVMIRDMEDSKRTNTNIHTSSMKANPVDAVMVSHIFWPSLQDGNMIHHPRMQEPLQAFGKAYGRLKNPRKLVWMNQLGSVDLELVVEDDGQPVVKEFSCAPALATLISHFEDRDEWTSEELSNETGLAEHVIQKRMQYWVHNRVLTCHRAGAGNWTYRTAADLTQAGDTPEDEEGQDQHAVSGTSQQREEEMEVYTSYIVGMLTNLGQLPLKTIHSNLKTFVTGSDIRYTQTPQQLSAFLQRLCQEGKLECGPDGLYRLVK